MGKPSLSKRMRESCIGLERLNSSPPGKLANAKLERLDLTNEFLGLRRQSCGVDVHARALHGRKHAHERHLDLGENVLRALSPKRGGERLTQDAGEPGGSSRGAHGIRRRAASPAAGGNEACRYVSAR